MTPGPLIILSGPSGSGKSTLVRRVVESGEFPLHVSVSATTRPPRAGERDGVDYHFWTPERFAAEERAGAFLETARVHGRHCYGTLRREVDAYRARGYGVVLVIDVQGAAKVRALCPDAVTVFLRTSSLKLYEERLRGRGTEDEAALARRLENARREEERVGEYRHVILNDDLGHAVAAFRAVLAPLFRGREATHERSD